MKKILLLWAALVAVLTVGAQNLAVNGDFSSFAEGKPTGWTFDKPAQVTIAQGVNKDLIVTNPTGTTKLYQQIENLTAGDTYVVSFKYKASHKKFRIWTGFAPTAGEIGGIVYIGGTNGAAADPFRSNNDYLAIATDFATWSNEITVPEGQTRMQLEFRYYTQTASSFTLSEVSVVKKVVGTTPEITAPATLAFSNVSTGNTEPKAITVSGANLTGDVTVAVAGEGFTCSTTTITKAEATAGKEITVTFAPTAVKDYTGTITLTSPGATEKVITLTGSGIDATYPIAANIAALKGKGIDDKTTEFTITGELTFVYRNGRNVFFKDATGGLLVYDNNPAVITTAYQEGDVISGMKGKIASYNGLFEFIPTQDPGAKVRNTGAVAPVEVSAADLKANIAQYESQLVKLSNMTFESGKSFAADKASNINMTNGATTIVCRDGFSQLLGKTPPATANVVGFATPYVIGTTNDVQVFPRGEGDIMSTVSVIAPTAKPSVWANAVSGVVTIHSAKAAQVEIYNIVGKKVASQAIEGTVNVRLERGVYIVKVNGQSIKVKN